MVPHTVSVAQKKMLVLETDPFTDSSDHLLPAEENVLDLDADMIPMDLNPSPMSSIGLPSSPLPPPPTQCELRAPIQHLPTMLSSSLFVQPEPSIPSSSGIRHIRETPSQHTSQHTSRHTTPLNRSGLNRGSLAPAPKPTKPPPAPFRQDYIPGSKPKVVNYDGGVEKLLLNAMHEYACLILTADAFPNEVKQIEWAKATWQAACDSADTYYECSSHMIWLVSAVQSLLHIADC